MSYTRISLRKKWDGNVSPDSGYQYALVYMISELRLIPFERWQSVDLDECLEARIFGKDAELHVFREDDEWMEVMTRDFPDPSKIEADKRAPISELSSPDDPGVIVRRFATIDRVHSFRNNCRKEVSGYSEIVIREYISYDEDGQAYTARTRLVDLL